jgi:hydrogenase maturation factor HypF (carbamoyltransferase family)
MPTLSAGKAVGGRLTREQGRRRGHGLSPRPAGLIVDNCRLLREGHDLSTVVLSGGAFENQLLRQRTVAAPET